MNSLKFQEAKLPEEITKYSLYANNALQLGLTVLGFNPILPYFNLPKLQSPFRLKPIFTIKVACTWVGVAVSVVNFI